LRQERERRGARAAADGAPHHGAGVVMVKTFWLGLEIRPLSLQQHNNKAARRTTPRRPRTRPSTLKRLHAASAPTHLPTAPLPSP
jgi:hypothetical protein